MMVSAQQTISSTPKTTRLQNCSLRPVWQYTLSQRTVD